MSTKYAGRAVPSLLFCGCTHTHTHKYTLTSSALFDEKEQPTIVKGPLLSSRYTPARHVACVMDTTLNVGVHESAHMQYEHCAMLSLHTAGVCCASLTCPAPVCNVVLQAQKTHTPRDTRMSTRGCQVHLSTRSATQKSLGCSVAHTKGAHKLQPCWTPPCTYLECAGCDGDQG